MLSSGSINLNVTDNKPTKLNSNWGVNVGFNNKIMEMADLIAPLSRNEKMIMIQWYNDTDNDQTINKGFH